jgi:hypothetical protein
MSQRSKLALLSVIGALSLSPALAQNVPPATSAPMAKEHSAQSIECSKQADAKGLHGKARKKFRSACKKAGSDKGNGAGGTDKQDVD